jgi:hypothetical protein
MNMTASPLSEKIERYFDSPGVAVGTIVFCVLLAYGFQLFSFHLTIDSEIHADYTGWIRAWATQGRWAMGALSFFVPSAIVPTVSPAIGLGFTALAWWRLLREVYARSRFETTLAIVVALTFPILAFTITFYTLAYGIGIASYAVYLFARSLRQRGIASLGLGCLAGAFAIAIYQTFIFELAMVSLVELASVPASNWQPRATRTLLSLFLALLAYWVIDYLVRLWMDVPLTYVSGFVDLHGFFAHPLERLATSARLMLGVLWLESDRFGLHSPWNAVLLAVIGAGGVLAFARRQTNWVTIGAALLLLGTPIFADAVAAGGAPFRSSFYINFLLCLLLAMGLRHQPSPLKIFATICAALAIIGNTSIVNRLNQSADTAYRLDEKLAFEIYKNVQALQTTDSNYELHDLFLVGDHSWAESRIMPIRETIGASFYQWDAGNPYRVAAFLRLAGVPVVAASPQEMRAEYQTALSMNQYPKPGWIRLDGKVLIVKFSDFTGPQRATLCAAGVTAACGSTSTGGH